LRSGYSRAFLDAVPAPDAEVEMALRHTQQSIELDPRDAMGHWTLGRAQFLAGEQDQAIQSVSSSLAVKPNFAVEHPAVHAAHRFALATDPELTGQKRHPHPAGGQAPGIAEGPELALRLHRAAPGQLGSPCPTILTMGFTW